MPQISYHINPSNSLRQIPKHRRSLAVNDRRDPTRTITLRAAYAREMRKRFRLLRGVIRSAIVDLDVFGIAGGHDGVEDSNDSRNIRVLSIYQANLPQHAFAFNRVSRKSQEFMEWLEGQIDEKILEVSDRRRIGDSIDETWQNVWIEDSYKRGVIRSNYEMRRRGFDVPDVDELGGIQGIMGMPMHADRLGVLYTRAFTELKGITDAMDQQISRVLTQGLADGDNPRLLARKLNATISGTGARDLGIYDSLGRFIPAERRAEIMARTEVIRAHHQGMIQEYKNWQVEGINVEAEFRTAEDDRVCPECWEVAAVGFYPLEEAMELIPVHPQCRCIAIPARPEDVQERLDNPDVYDLNPEWRDEYLMARNNYDEFFSRYSESDLRKMSRNSENAYFATEHISLDINDIAQRDFPNLANGFETWQHSATTAGALRIKQIARQVERRVGNKLGWESADRMQRLLNLPDAASISVNEYIKARAFNQSFLRAAGVGRMRLYRGIGGKAGERLRDQFTRSGMRRTRFSFDEATVTGWSSSKEVGLTFAEGGLAVEDVIPRDRVYMHHFLMNSISGNYQNYEMRVELESLIFGGRRSFRRNRVLL